MTSEPVHCIDCAHFDLRRHATMARHGFGACNLDAPGRFYSATYGRKCTKFSPADPEVSAHRRQWLDARRIEFQKRTGAPA